MKDLKISILLPTYNRSNIVVQTIGSILRQSFKNFEILVLDDCSTDDTESKCFNDERIVYYRNKERLGYGRNLKENYKKATGDILFLMGDDDILLRDALLKTYNAFLKGDHIGLVTRPYYWFWEDPKVAIRTVSPYDPYNDSVISIFDGQRQIKALFESAGQLSGLAFRRKYIDMPFHEDIFTAHIYPFASILRKYKAVYLKDFTVAVRTPLSMSTHRKEIYDMSPLESWVRMFEVVYGDEPLSTVRDRCIRLAVKDSLPGLFQIKTTALQNKLVLREIRVILNRYPECILDPHFYIYSMTSLIIPARPLRKLIDWYKICCLSRFYRHSTLNYTLEPNSSDS